MVLYVLNGYDKISILLILFIKIDISPIDEYISFKTPNSVFTLNNSHNHIK